MVAQPALLRRNAPQATYATVRTTSQAAAAAALKAASAPKGLPREVVRVTHTSSADKRHSGRSEGRLERARASEPRGDAYHKRWCAWRTANRRLTPGSMHTSERGGARGQRRASKNGRLRVARQVCSGGAPAREEHGGRGRDGGSADAERTARWSCVLPKARGLQRRRGSGWRWRRREDEGRLQTRLSRAGCGGNWHQARQDRLVERRRRADCAGVLAVSGGWRDSDVMRKGYGRGYAHCV
eukprot:6195495-Pleurochrysis_carterae.AAC.2